MFLGTEIQFEFFLSFSTNCDNNHLISKLSILFFPSSNGMVDHFVVVLCIFMANVCMCVHNDDFGRM